MSENEIAIFESIYENIDETKAFAITFIICCILLSILFIAFMAGLCGSLCPDIFFRKKKNVYTPSTYFKNSLCKSIEDSIYFSEVSPSSDSVSNCSLGSRKSKMSSLTESGSKSWFALQMRRKSFSMLKNEKPATVQLYLKFVPSNEETHQHGKLHISIKNVLSIPIKDYPRYTEAYLIIRLIRVHRTLKGRSETVICENCTRNYRNTRDIEIDEHFIVDAKKNDLNNWNLILTAYDQDIYTKPSELASAVIPLSNKYKELCTQKDGVELTVILKQIPKNVGNLLVGLSYLPTSQRLSVNIVRVANLPHSKDTNKKMYAQLFLLTGVTGRSLKRKKLSFNIPEDDPYDLNGTISFDITPNLLESVTLLIILYKKGKEPDKIEYPIETIETETNLKTCPDHCYGSVAIGNLVTNYKGKKHWRMMTMAPRRVVTVWHYLK